MKYYYLWKAGPVFYITDYHEMREDGMVHVDKHGWIKADLVFSSHNKKQVIAWAMQTQ